MASLVSPLASANILVSTSLPNVCERPLVVSTIPNFPLFLLVFVSSE